MEPTHRFGDPELDQTLAAFLEIIVGALRERLVSVVLQGSVVFGDLAPGYGDLDFVAVVDDDLDEESCARLTELRRPLREGRCGPLGPMVEGAFLPRRMLDPANRGCAFWWGTSGERRWDENKLGWLVLRVTREHGIVIWGHDIREEIPLPARKDMLAEMRDACQAAREHGRGGGVKAVDWLLTAARLLYWLQEDEFSSKTEAADWGCAHAQGEWRQLLPRAKELRCNPRLAESEETRGWLDALTAPIRDAWIEVERAVAKAEAGLVHRCEGPTGR
jgi:predicted nucleotidyltransferase